MHQAYRWPAIKYIRILLKSEVSELELVSMQLYREKNLFVCLSVSLYLCFCVCLPMGRVA